MEIFRCNCNDLKEGLNFINDYVIWKDGNVMNVVNNVCKHKGGRFGKPKGKATDIEDVVTCSRHGWQLSMKECIYTNPKGNLRQERLRTRIENGVLIFYGKLSIIELSITYSMYSPPQQVRQPNGMLLLLTL